VAAAIILAQAAFCFRAFAAGSENMELDQKRNKQEVDKKNIHKRKNTEPAGA